MKPYIVSAPTKHIVDAYAKWMNIAEASEHTVMNDGWTLPSLRFSHLYEAHAAALDLAMVSGSVNPMRDHKILISEFISDQETPN